MTSSFRKYYVFYTWNNYAWVLWNGHTVSIQFIQNRKSQHVTLNSAVARVGVTLWNSSLIRPCKIIVSWCMTGKHSGSGLMMPHDAFRDISRGHKKDCLPSWWCSAAKELGNCRERLIMARSADINYLSTNYIIIFILWEKRLLFGSFWSNIILEISEKTEW